MPAFAFQPGKSSTHPRRQWRRRRPSAGAGCSRLRGRRENGVGWGGFGSAPGAPAQAADAARLLLGDEMGGCRVEELMSEQWADMAREQYPAILNAEET